MNSINIQYLSSAIKQPTSPVGLKMSINKSKTSLDELSFENRKVPQVETWQRIENYSYMRPL